MKEDIDYKLYFGQCGEARVNYIFSMADELYSPNEDPSLDCGTSTGKENNDYKGFLHEIENISFVSNAKHAKRFRREISKVNKNEWMILAENVDLVCFWILFAPTRARKRIFEFYVNKELQKNLVVYCRTILQAKYDRQNNDDIYLAFLNERTKAKRDLLK